MQSFATQTTRWADAAASNSSLILTDWEKLMISGRICLHSGTSNEYVVSYLGQAACCQYDGWTYDTYGGRYGYMVYIYMGTIADLEIVDEYRWPMENRSSWRWGYCQSCIRI